MDSRNVKSYFAARSRTPVPPGIIPLIYSLSFESVHNRSISLVKTDAPPIRNK